MNLDYEEWLPSPYPGDEPWPPLTETSWYERCVLICDRDDKEIAAALEG